MNKIKKIFVVLFLIQSQFISICFALTDSLIGTVGNKPVMQSDIVNEMKMLLIINDESFSEEKRAELQSVALKSYTTTLIKQIGIEKYNITHFNQVDLIIKINNIAKNLNMDSNKLKNYFKKASVPFSHLTNRIETELKWNSLIFELYKNRIDVNFNEISDQLELIKKKSFIEEYNIAEILLETKTKDEIQEKINWINKEIETNGFNKTATKYSRSESSINGGRLGWVKETMLSEKIKRILKNTEKDSIAEPILSPNGIFILKLIDKKTSRVKVDLEKEKNLLLQAEKNKKLNIYSFSHYNRLKQSILINYKRK